MSAPTSRPVHPCVMSVFDGNRGAEYSTWAFITTRPPECPNLVTAQASSLRVYTLDEDSGKLCEVYKFTNLAGNVCYLERLPSASADSSDSHENNHNNNKKKIIAQADSLILGFCGHPRLTVVSVTPHSPSSPSPAVLSASSLIDLTQALIDNSFGSITPLDQDLVATTVSRKRNNGATIAVVLGAGVSVACIELSRCKKQSGGGWLASEPFLLPLPSLQASLKRSQSAKLQSTAGGGSGFTTGASGSAAASNASSIATGFGDILSATFLPGYNEPTIVLLHSNLSSHGRAWSGRLGRPHWQPATRFGMLVTAISVTVAHQRSAVLWSVEVPADAVSVYRIGRHGCLVVCTNSLVLINNAGRVDDFLAVNGYVRSTCPPRLLELLRGNPKPFPRLSIQLDGAAIAFCSDLSVFISLRGGGLYLLQLPAPDLDWSQQGRGGNKQNMFLVPLGQSLGACGNVANLIAWPLARTSTVLFDKLSAMKMGDKKDAETSSFSMGLLFAGSRLGDSHFLGYVLETINVPWEEDDRNIMSTNGKKIKLLSYSACEEEEDNEDIHGVDLQLWLPSQVSPEVEAILQSEEDALYAPSSMSGTQLASLEKPDVVPPSDEESETLSSHPPLSSALSGGKRKLSRILRLSLVRALTVMDTLVGLGPIGPSCEGPITAPHLRHDEDVVVNPNATAVPGATALVMPCGYGSGGGIGILTACGRDERSILFEKDVLDVQSVFSLRSLGLVFVGKQTGIRLLRLQNSGSETSDSEKQKGAVDLTELDPIESLSSSDSVNDFGSSTRDFFARVTLLCCAEFFDGAFVLVFSCPNEQSEQHDRSYGIAVGKVESGLISLISTSSLPSDGNKGDLLSMSPLVQYHGIPSAIVFACTWSAGSASLVICDRSGIRNVHDIGGADGSDEPMVDSDSEKATNAYYSSRRIVAVDLFRAPANFFPLPGESGEENSGPFNNGDSVFASTINSLGDDNDLYIVSDNEQDQDPSVRSSDFAQTSTTSEKEQQWEDDVLFLAICRQSGELEIFPIANFLHGEAKPIWWSADGCSYGSTSLSIGNEHTARQPRQHEVCVKEMRFFYCGPTALDESEKEAPGLSRPLCLAVETSAGDLFLYAADVVAAGSAATLHLTRVPLKKISRESQEQTRFHAKLRRKGIVNKNDVAGDSSCAFQHSKLHRFHSLSGQDGLFAAVTRPLWLVAERGIPTAIVHRSRHAAPTGGNSLPVSGFCSDLDGVGSFMTVHRRVGRVGSQRLTLYRGISTMFSNEGLLPGAGICLEKIPLGVTVRRIQFLDDASLCSAGRCLYAMLVSRELEEDTSHLNDDGMTREEREKIEQEKEAAKIKRQVEADLGGFDVEQEWVEEIEREDCFQIDKDLGGAPPIPQCSYALWIVDAANRWMVVDSHNLDEYEHALTMSCFELTDFPDEPGSSNANEIESEELESKLFIAIGVGIVDKNGEDVSSKGKVLLFQVEAREDASLVGVTSRGVELALVCEKDIFHGPVTSLSCLTSEGKHRLVIGAGADINVEQWGNGRLTQVGFFRATMMILDIFVFKNFLLLSDAYDSLYFLVWRESDKSLTLLSKDYDPLAVYAAGTMSRGGSLSFICQDDRQNLQFFQYAPGEAAARGGNKLVCRADFHLGAQTSAFRNHACRSSLWVNSASPSSTLAALKQQDTFFGRGDDDQRIGVTFGTSDGGLGAVVPLSEPVYWRLAALQSVMANALESDCALSQRAWRLYKRSFRRGGCRSTDRKKGVIDGDLIRSYADLPLYTQEDLASAIGSTVGLILDNLLELDCASSPL